MTTTEIIAPDGTVLFANRIPARAVYAVLEKDNDYPGRDWTVRSTHTLRDLAEAQLRHVRGCFSAHFSFDLVQIPGRTETGTSGYEQGESS